MSAIDDLRFLEKRFRGILELLPTLEGVSSVENHLKELLAKKDYLIKEVSKSQAEVDAVVVAAQKDLEAKIAGIKAAESEAKAIVQQAKTAAEGIIANADVKAAEVIKVASTKADELLAEQKAQKDVLSNLNSLVSEKQAIYNELTGKLSALKAKL